MKTINKLFTVIALAVVLVGTTFALPVRQDENAKIEKSKQKMWEQAVNNFEKMALKANSEKGGLVAEQHQLAFMFGHYVMRASYDAYFAELNGDSSYEDVIGDIEILMDFFEGDREVVMMENLLKAIEDGRADTNQIYAVMRELEETAREEMSDEERWFSNYGVWTTCLLGDTYLGEDEYIIEDVFALQDLANIAPVETAQEILTPVDNLAKFTEQDNFTDEDYEEINNNAFEIFDLVFGE